jgi:hypothetical protein
MTASAEPRRLSRENSLQRNGMVIGLFVVGAAVLMSLIFKAPL